MLDLQCIHPFRFPFRLKFMRNCNASLLNLIRNGSKLQVGMWQVGMWHVACRACQGHFVMKVTSAPPSTAHLLLQGNRSHFNGPNNSSLEIKMNQTAADKQLLIGNGCWWHGVRVDGGEGECSSLATLINAMHRHAWPAALATLEIKANSH